MACSSGEQGGVTEGAVAGDGIERGRLAARAVGVDDEVAGDRKEPAPERAAPGTFRELGEGGQGLGEDLVGEVGRLFTVRGSPVAVAEHGIDVPFVERSERFRLVLGTAHDRQFTRGRIARDGRGFGAVGMACPEAMVWCRGQHGYPR